MKNNGWLSENFENPRDYCYERVCGSVDGDYPSYYMIPEENMGTQKDQGRIGACVAETIAQISEEWWRRQFGKQEEHSEGFIYGALRDESHLGYGMYTSKALKKWMEIGTLPKVMFDILIEMPELRDLITNREDLFEIAKKYKLSAFVKLNGANRDLQVKDALTKYKYGLVSAGDGHCMQLVGWNDEKDEYICRDSYGHAKDGGNGYKDKKKNKITEIYLPLFSEVKLPFTDVKEDDWYFKNVKNLHFAGLMNGTSDSIFEPHRNLTRAEAAALIDRVYSTMVDLVRTTTVNTNEKIELLEKKIELLEKRIS